MMIIGLYYSYFNQSLAWIRFKAQKWRICIIQRNNLSLELLQSDAYCKDDLMSLKG